MKDLGLIIQNEKVVVSSRKVSEIYEKQHAHVMRDIRSILETIPESLSNFGESSYINEQNRDMPMYLMDRQGFSMLVMGFTGEKAKRFTYQYTLAFEEMSKSIQQKPSCIEDVLIQSLHEMKAMRLEVAAAKEIVTNVQVEVDVIRNTIIINPKAEWRRDTNRILNVIGKQCGDFEKPRAEAYEALKQRGNCRPSILINNLKSRALLNGMSSSKAESLNLLDVLENEPRLKEIYISIVKEMAIKYKAV